MLSDAQREHVTRATRTMQIITGAIAAGLLFFAVIVLFLATRDGAARPAAEPFLTYIAVAFAAAAFIAWVVVPPAIAARMRQSIVNGDGLQTPVMRVPNAAELGDVLPLTTLYQTRLIVGAALIEGAGFFCLIAYMLERQQLSLILATVLLLVLLMQIPTVSRVESWVEKDLAAIDQLRLMR